MNEQLNIFWEEVLTILKNETSQVSYTTWFATVKPIKLENNILYLEAINNLAVDILNNRYSLLIKNAIFQITNTDYDISIVLPSNSSETTSRKKEVLQLDDNLGNLIPKYIFETFVIGNSNRLAHAAAVAVAEAPSKAYNPLFLYGGVGLGKTHLMHAIGHYILSQNSSAKILYVSSEKFTNELINAIKDDKNEEFRNKYRSIDVLMIDDIQFIAGKERTQEEFFHTFNTLHEANKQIIISSDRPPKEIETLEERLRSRFEWGLIADIQVPDLETRIAILRKKADSEKYDIPNEVMVFVANSIISNIRELEGALNRVVAFSNLKNQPISIELANDALKDFISNNRPKAVTVDYIQELVSEYYNLKPEDFKAKKRNKGIVYPRQIAMYLSRKLTDTSLPQIGQKFGGRDHTTVLHGFNKIMADINKDSELKKVIDNLEKKITGN